MTVYSCVQLGTKPSSILHLRISFSWLVGLRELAGFETTAANLLSVPVYAWACLVTVAVGFLGDRIGHRAWINLYTLPSWSYYVDADLS